MAGGARFDRSVDGAVLQPRGRWVLSELDPGFRARLAAVAGSIREIDCSGIEALDTAGALLLHTTAERFGLGGPSGLRTESDALYRQVAELAERPDLAPPVRSPFVYRVGVAAMDIVDEARRYLGFVGELAMTAAASVTRPAQLRWQQMFGVFETAGWGALPILGLLSFLIGVVVAYQAGAP